jgi:hypothetical protein
MWAEEHDELGRILNQALSAYPAEPLLGIEARILRRVRTEGQATKWTASSSVWGWALATLFSIALIAAGVFLTRNGAVQKTANPIQAAAGHPSTGLKVPPATREIPEGEGTARAAVRRSALPKLDVFPTPSPLTSEELALVKMAKAASLGATALEATAPPANGSTVQPEPIQVQALEIKPLVVSGAEDGDK